MENDILSALISLAIALLVAFPLGRALKRCPAAFYLAALALVAAHLYYSFAGLYFPNASILVNVMHKGYLACAFLGVVMFTGVLDENSAARGRLAPIRAELSIVSFILMLSHAIVFLPVYLPRLANIMARQPIVATSLVVAFALVLVYALLTVTSLHVLRVKMPPRIWKAIQRLAYAMVVLLYVHILLALGRPVFMGHGSVSAKFALAIYSAVLIAYVVLRVRKARRDRERRTAQQVCPYARGAVGLGAK